MPGILKKIEVMAAKKAAAYSSLLLAVLFFLAPASEAREYELDLPLIPGKQQVFFLDLAGTGADSGTFQLYTSSGETVPFSFDPCLELPAAAGEFRRQSDGLYSKEQAPASENRYLRPGWLSYHAVEGAEGYVLRFRDGAKNTLPRPNPTLRAWWIEIMRDPQFKDLKLLQHAKDQVRTLKKGGIEASKTFFWKKDALQVDERIKGRRIIAVLRAEGQGKNFYALSLKNAVLENDAIKPYFELAAGETSDICCEGLIANKPGGLFRGARPGAMHLYNPPLKIYFLHVQLPPFEHNVGLRLPSNLYNVGDRVIMSIYGQGYETLKPFTSAGINCAGVYSRSGRPEVKTKLLDSNGREIKEYDGLEFTLQGLKAGEYRLETVLGLPGDIWAQQSFQITLQDGPKW